MKDFKGLFVAGMGIEPTTFCWWGSHATAASPRYTIASQPDNSNCGAKVVIKLSFCCWSFNTNAFLLALRQFLLFSVHWGRIDFRAWRKCPLSVIHYGGARKSWRKSRDFSIGEIYFFGTYNRSFVWYAFLPCQSAEDKPKISRR